MNFKGLTLMVALSIVKAGITLASIERGVTMTQRHTSLIALCLFVLAGCTTPAPVKQALVDLDQGYGENVRLMQQYRQLVQNVNERHRYWHRYAKQRLLLDLALKSMTQDHWKDAEDVADTGIKLGEELLRVVNELRLPGLMEQEGRAKQNDREVMIKFAAGKDYNTASKIVERMPEIVNRVTEKVENDYKKENEEKLVTVDMNYFDVYLTNVAALRQINATIKRYLDIDVTISPKDVSEIAKSIRKLQE
jgi:hypothetical protein